MEWIKVKDKLPKEECSCIIFAWDRVLPAYFIDGSFYEIDYNGSPELANAVYWMELPNKPN